MLAKLLGLNLPDSGREEDVVTAEVVGLLAVGMGTISRAGRPATVHVVMDVWCC